MGSAPVSEVVHAWNPPSCVSGDGIILLCPEYCLGSSRVQRILLLCMCIYNYIYTPVSGGSCLVSSCVSAGFCIYTCVRRILHSYTYTCVRRILLEILMCLCIYIIMSGGSCLGSSCVSRGSCMGSSLEQNYIHAYIHRSLDSA